LLLDVDGYVAEGAGENISIVKKGKLYTPDLTSCSGRHHARSPIITRPQELGIEVIENAHPRRDLPGAEKPSSHGTAGRSDPDPRTRTSATSRAAVQRGPITANLQQGIFSTVSPEKHPQQHRLAELRLRSNAVSKQDISSALHRK